LTNFKTLPEVYADPFGNPFYISCAGLEPPTCRVHYELYEDVGLRFEFHRSELKIGKVLDFDRALRSLIADAEVKDFVWADPN
jgi:hypothetical protein